MGGSSGHSLRTCHLSGYVALFWRMAFGAGASSGAATTSRPRKLWRRASRLQDPAHAPFVAVALEPSVACCPTPVADAPPDARPEMTCFLADILYFNHTRIEKIEPHF